VTATPSIELSVLIATHDRRELLGRCLRALAEQTLEPGRFEVIVAEDGGEPGNAEAIEALALPYRVNRLELEKAGKSAALNAAIEAAAAEVCVFLDDDIIAAPELLAEHLEAHRRDPRALGIGRLTQAPPDGNDWFAQAYAVGWNHRYEELAHKPLDWTDCYGGNMSAPRSVLREVGGFAEDLGAIEDLEVGYRLTRAGCRPVYLAQAAGLHDDQKGRERIIHDNRRFGAYCAEFARRDATMARLISWFPQPTARDVTLRRVLLALRLPPATLASAGRLIPGSGPRQVWHGFVSRYTFWLGVRTAMSRREWKRATRGVPVLMYHAFSEGESEDRFIVSRRELERQTRLLKLLRYRTILFDDLVALLRSGAELPPRSVAITIDDGYRDNLEVAWPILRRRRLIPTIYLVADKIGGRSDWDDEGGGEGIANRPLLSAEEIGKLREEGVAFGAHTRTHPTLTRLDDEQLAEETHGSREELQRQLDEPVRSLAYPYGGFDQRVAQATEEAGFAGACTVENTLVNRGEDPLTVPRLEIKGEDSLATFLRKIWFGGP